MSIVPNTLRIGRVDISHNERTRVESISLSGDSLSISGDFREGDQTAVSAAVQRINGLINSRDEPVIPVVWDEGPPDVPGFYRVVGGRVNGVKQLMPSGRATFSLELQRVPGFAAPMFENRVLGDQRVDTEAGVPDPQPFVALPASVRGFEAGNDLTASLEERLSQDGPVNVYTTSDDSTLFDATPTFYVSPEDWYVGAATMRVGGEIVVGRQIRGLPTDWEISNGLVRFTIAGGKIVAQRFDGAMWDRSRPIVPFRRIDAGTKTDLPAPHTVTVLRNSPTEVAIRLTYDAESVVPGSFFAVTLDLSVRRGSRIVALHLKTRGAYQWGFRVENWGTTLGTELDGGLHLTNCIVTRDDDLSGGIEDTTSLELQHVVPATSFAGGVGFYTTGETPQSIINQWAAAQTERVDAVVR